MDSKTPAPKKAEKVKTCAAHRPRWMISGQPACKLPTIRPAAALCKKHDAMWKAAGGRAQWRDAKAPKPKAAKRRVAISDRTDAEQIASLEAEGMTTSDAQAAVDAEGRPPRLRRVKRRTGNASRS